MALKAIDGGAGRIEQSDRGLVTIAEYLANYHSGSVDALYDLGVALSTGSHGSAGIDPRTQLSGVLPV